MVYNFDYFVVEDKTKRTNVGTIQSLLGGLENKKTNSIKMTAIGFKNQYKILMILSCSFYDNALAIREA